MGQVKVDGDLILLDRIEKDEALRRRLEGLKHGDNVELDIAGAVQRWERTLVDVDGTFVDAIKPTDGARAAWAKLPTGQLVDIGIPQEGSRLATFGQRLYLWDTPQNQIH